jgi:hypothetical protein
MLKTQEKIRREWIEASQFHPLTNAQVLGQVHSWVERDIKAARQPVLLLDLDSTLYEVGPRSHQILREWLEHPESHAYGEIRDRLHQLKPEQVGYSLRDTFEGLGLKSHEPRVAEVLKATGKFWSSRFFTNEYLEYDHAYPGAPEFVQKAYELGAEIIYLTGRDEPGMGKGTRSRLIGDGFPFDKERTHLLLKKNFELDDLEHKSEAAHYIRKTGDLVASFENEPPNLIALSELFPAAMHVFADTVYSEKPAMPKAGLYRITGFK